MRFWLKPGHKLHVFYNFSLTIVTVHTSICITYREVVEMKEIKVINALDIAGKETPFSELTVKDQKQMAEKIRDTVMNFAGYRRKTA